MCFKVTYECFKCFKIQFSFNQKFLGEHPEIFITRLNKDNFTVVTYKTEYIQNMSEMLGDTATYNILVYDPTQKYEKSTNDMIQELFKMEIMVSKTQKVERA